MKPPSVPSGVRGFDFGLKGPRFRVDPLPQVAAKLLRNREPVEHDARDAESPFARGSFSDRRAGFRHLPCYEEARTDSEEADGHDRHGYGERVVLDLDNPE